MAKKLTNPQLFALRDIAGGREHLLTHYMLRTLRKAGLVKKGAIEPTAKGYAALRGDTKAEKKPAAKPNLPKQGEPPLQEQIDEMIVRLEEVHKKVVQYTMFGDDNCFAIEVMIEVLRDDLTDEEIEQREEDEWSEHAANHARDARNWLDGQSDELDLADGWPLR